MKNILVSKRLGLSNRLLHMFYSNMLIHRRLYSSSLDSETSKYAVRFVPELVRHGKMIIPISMGRYNLSEKKRKEYDTILNALFLHTSDLLRLNIVSQVDVLSTADLQQINWDAGLVKEIEQHFFTTHKDLLKKQSNVYQWNEWLALQGRAGFEKNYELITEKSKPSTEWYSLMVRTHHNVTMSASLDKSLEYQRREYAAVMLMKDYSQLIYTGPLSIAWAYMYQILIKFKLPMFTQARFENLSKEHAAMSVSDVRLVSKLVLGDIREILTDDNLPKEAKESFISAGLTLFYAYGSSRLYSEDKVDKETFAQAESNRIKPK